MKLFHSELSRFALGLKMVALATLWIYSSYTGVVDTAQAYEGSGDYCDENPTDPMCDERCKSSTPPPDCYDDCQSQKPPPKCDPCNGPNPPSSCMNYYCGDGSYCSEYEDTTPCNYNPTGEGVPEPKQSRSSDCDCSCKDDTKYFCNDEFYCDGDTPTNYDPSKVGEPGWEEDNSTCTCEARFFCDDAEYCDDAPACNYAPEHRGVYPWVVDNGTCYCQDYCPDEDDPNYKDPKDLSCPRADETLCSVKVGCMDSTAHNYDSEAVQHDQEMCRYLKESTCSYSVSLSVVKPNSFTGNLRKYLVGVVEVKVISVLVKDPNSLPPECPTVDPTAFTTAHASAVYNLLFPSWPGHTTSTVDYSNDGELEDMCQNIAGFQETIPASYVLVDGDCITQNSCYELGCSVVGDTCVCADMCPNIAGRQETIPAGYYLDEANDCVTAQECSANGCSITDGMCKCPVAGDCAPYLPNPSGPMPSGALCSAGTATTPVEVADEWQFSCLGTYGGTTESCTVDSFCPGTSKFCAANPIGSQCVSQNACCEGFVMCPNGQCQPGTLANCSQPEIICDETVTPPFCTRIVGPLGDVNNPGRGYPLSGSGVPTGTNPDDLWPDGIVKQLRMTPPVSDSETNTCEISWRVESEGGTVTCELTRGGADVMTYASVNTDTNYSRTVTPGGYEVFCYRTTTEYATEGDPTTVYTLQTEDERTISCVQNPNYEEF